MRGCYEKEIKFSAIVNIKTGDIYLNDSKILIFCKHLVRLLLLLPIYTAVKTGWHLSIIGPLAYEIFNTYKGLQNKTTCVKHVILSLQDIVRTPVYQLAIAITLIFALIIAPFSPTSLYKTREWIGHLDRDLLRIETIHQESPWLITRCYSPFRNLGYLYQQAKDEKVIKVIEYLEYKLKLFCLSFLGVRPTPSQRAKNLSYYTTIEDRPLRA